LSSIDAGGFLQGHIDEWEKQHLARNEDLFQSARAVNRESHTFVARHTAGEFSPQLLTSLTLFVRMLELYQGTVLLAARGLRSASRVIFRSFLEAYFHFAAIHNDSSYLADYLNQFEVERKRLINRIRRSEEDALAELRRPIDDALIAEIEAIKHKKVTVEDVAKRGGQYVLYATAYAMLSRSVHSAAADLEDHLALDRENKEIEGFRYGPSDKETVRTVALAGVTLSEVLEQMGKLFNDDVAHIAKPLVTAFESYLDRHQGPV
jgi:hypothetical protein